jgi:hypothetical protein
LIKMRVILTALIIAVAGISTASAQQPATEHGDGAGASQPANAAAPPASGKAPAAAGGPLTPSQSTDFSINGASVIRAAPPLTPEEEKADADGRSAWQTRCRPTVVEDRDGMRRAQYAESDCDLSRFNTAGAK